MCKTHPPAQLSGPYHFSISIWNRKITSSREKTPTCFLSAGQSKCEAAGLKLGRLHYCCRVAATEPAAVVFAGYEIILISPSLRSGEIRHYFFAADYLRLPKFSLTNWCIFRENTPNFHKFVLCMVLWTEPPLKRAGSIKRPKRGSLTPRDWPWPHDSKEFVVKLL